jgi:hypothetical protein
MLGVGGAAIANKTNIGQEIKKYSKEHWWGWLFGSVIGAMLLIGAASGIVISVGGQLSGTYFYVVSLVGWMLYTITNHMI